MFLLQFSLVCSFCFVCLKSKQTHNVATNVVTNTSLQRHDVAATLMRCCVFAGFVLCHRVILPIPKCLGRLVPYFCLFSCIYFCVHLCHIFCLNEAGEATSFWSLLSHFESPPFMPFSSVDTRKHTDTRQEMYLQIFALKEDSGQNLYRVHIHYENMSFQIY